MSGSSTARVVVVGSANVDRTVRTRIPRPGETVLGAFVGTSAGGKGANQAVAARRAGATVEFVGCIGQDDDGRLVLDALSAHDLDARQVLVRPGWRTGVAYVLLSDDGENAIVVVPGANAELTASDVELALASLDSRDIVLCQGEVPPPAIEAVARVASRVGARFVLNLAPVVAVATPAIASADPLVVNESEAGALLGRHLQAGDDMLRAAAELRERARSVVITLGADGALLRHDKSVHVHAEPVDTIDTTGAGDAFVGSLAAALAAGEGLEQAVGRAVEAGTAAVQRLGAQVAPTF